MHRTRRRRGLAAAAAVVATAALVASCSTSKPSSGVASVPLNGITASTVKVGFTVVQLGTLEQALGFKVADYGGVGTETKQINAVVDYINAHGGMGGRKVQADLRTYTALTDSPEQSQAACDGFTQDDRVFGIVLDAALQNNTVPCYTAAHTIIADETEIAHDQTQFVSDSPYLWSPTQPEYTSFLKAQLAAMNSGHFFDGNTGVLVVPDDDPVSRRAATTVVKPYLDSLGITNEQTSYVNGTNTGLLGATSATAIAAGTNARLNRVISVGGARILAVALSVQAAGTYRSTWGISTFDDPAWIQLNGAAIAENRRPGMVGFGYAPSRDLPRDTGGPPFPDPSNPMQVLCHQIVTDAGASPPNNARNNWTEALQYCDGAMFMKSVLDKLPGKATVTGEQFKDAAFSIGSSYRSSVTFGAAWGPNVYAGTDAGQPIAWDASTNAFNYTGGLQTFGAPVVQTGAAASSAPTTATVTGPLPTITAPAP